MELINLPIQENQVYQHSNAPLITRVEQGIPCSEMPPITWHRVVALGFDMEDERAQKLSSKEIETAAELFLASGISFSLLCERPIDSSCIVFAVGSSDVRHPVSIMRGAFGTIREEVYEPAFPSECGLYAKHFAAVRMNESDLDSREVISSSCVIAWVDEVSRILSDFPGMIRLDFQPLDAGQCVAQLASDYDTISKISSYLDSSIQVSDNISPNTHLDLVGEEIKRMRANTELVHSSSGSLSWKNSDPELDEMRKAKQYHAHLLRCAQKDGWLVDFSVSADPGLGRINSAESESRAGIMTAPLSAAIIKMGYTCSWEHYSRTRSKDSIRGLLLPTFMTKQLVSFPSVPYYGFERMTNRYYNVNVPVDDNSISFAKLVRNCDDVQDYSELSIEIALPKKEINRHIFVCGMTGSGKTNTIYHLLSSIGDLPFLVIEPVKSEYRSLPNVKTYTMTAGSTQALCMNPFWFPKGSSLQYHVDCLKQIISAAFDLYAAMPNILEQCLVRVYLHCGWDFVQGTNIYETELPDSMLYPTFSDLCQEVDDYLTRAKFGEETKGNYQGALLSRLKSFTTGAKGMLLNTSEHIGLDDLKTGKVVISLDSLADDSDKSIVMGVILAQYYQFLKVENQDITDKGLKHITVIEEAHHLFAGDAGGKTFTEAGSGQKSSQELVKTLNNMLAEIRAYGEGFIIVDQSPSALHSAVLKNTGIKIAHRIDYGTDIDAMQEVLLLDQGDHELAALQPGTAFLQMGGMRAPAKIYIPLCETKDEASILASETVHGNSIISHLMEDEALAKEMTKIAFRLLNQLLFDDLKYFGSPYQYLCELVNQALITYGYAEMSERIFAGTVLAEYLGRFISKTAEEMLPAQYCTAKMLQIFVERVLTIAMETDGDMSMAEAAAFEDYRSVRIWSRMRKFWSIAAETDVMCIKTVLNDSVPETKLVTRIVRDLKYIDETASKVHDNKEIYSNYIRLLEDHYFLTAPVKPVESSLWNEVLCCRYALLNTSEEVKQHVR